MRHTIEKEYPYVLSIFHILAALSMGIGGGTFMAFKAHHNNVGVIINGIIELGPNGATIFYWVVAITVYSFAIIGILGLISRMKGYNRIGLTAEGIIVPNPPWKLGESFLPYHSIRGLAQSKINNINILTIKTNNGSYRIAGNRLNDADAFNNITQTLVERSKIS